MKAAAAFQAAAAAAPLSTTANKDGAECAICCDLKPPSDFPCLHTAGPTSHGNSVCTSCIAKHLHEEISIKCRIKVTCPLAECEADLGDDDLRRLGAAEAAKLDDNRQQAGYQKGLLMICRPRMYLSQGSRWVGCLGREKSSDGLQCSLITACYITCDSIGYVRPGAYLRHACAWGQPAMLIETCHPSVSSNPSHRWCAHPGCGAGQLHSGGCDRPLMICNACRRPTCFVHRIPNHNGLTCAQYDQQQHAAGPLGVVGTSSAGHVWQTT